jgi:AAA15 family ATPase/GTPase
MINKIKLKNFGNNKNIEWNNLSNINLIIGANGSGKSFLLKALYCSIKTIEDYKRGDDNRNEVDILSERLYWTFQTEKIGDIVSKLATEPLYCEILSDNKEFSYEFGKDTVKKIQTLTNRTDPRESNSAFLPSKEVISLFQIILKSRDQDRAFGFDDTYLDLVRALVNQPQKGRNFDKFSESRKKLGKILDGKIEFDQTTNRWQFKRRNQKFSIGVTSEGIKKIAILDTLLANKYIDTKSIIFIDEPESALHPKAISDFLDIVAILAESGIQFFLASHSYFVLKKLALIAKEKNISIPVISMETDSEIEASYDDLNIAMPQNSIIDESIRLYKEEISEVMK